MIFNRYFIIKLYRITITLLYINFCNKFYKFSKIFEYNINSILIYANYRIILKIYINNINNETSRIIYREKNNELRITFNTISELYNIKSIYLNVNIMIMILNV